MENKEAKYEQLLTKYWKYGLSKIEIKVDHLHKIQPSRIGLTNESSMH